jgi:hypothetical protein
LGERVLREDGSRGEEFTFITFRDVWFLACKFGSGLRHLLANAAAAAATPNLMVIISAPNCREWVVAGEWTLE